MPRDKAVSHERIVQAAMREFQQKGFEQASMKAVAAEVMPTASATAFIDACSKPFCWNSRMAA